MKIDQEGTHASGTLSCVFLRENTSLSLNRTWHGLCVATSCTTSVVYNQPNQLNQLLTSLVTSLAAWLMPLSTWRYAFVLTIPDSAMM